MKEKSELMIFLQVSQTSFGYDQFISSATTVITFLVFILTLLTLIYNSLKEKTEAKNRSQKTLSMMDFILEDSNETAKKYLKKIKYIKEEPMKHYYSKLSLEQTEEAYQKWYDINNKNKPFLFDTLYEGIKVEFPHYDPYVNTKIECNYVILEIFRVLKTEGFLDDLKTYRRELKENLENQHLNITSDSLEKISYKIHGLKECKRILDSIRIEKLLWAAHFEDKKTKEQIEKHLGKDMHEFIREEYRKVLELEKALEIVTKALSNGGIK